jgi:DNA-damage-inducible protein D
MPTGPDFEQIKHINNIGREYWSARELMDALGYDYWQNFEKVIKKAMIATTSPEIDVALKDHFSDVTKMITIGKGGKRKVKDYFLSRRACYLIAQNGDPEKPEIAAAQNYFAFTAEVYEQKQGEALEMQRAHLEQEKRLALRLKVGEEHLHISSTALQSGVKKENLGLFHDAGYQGMYTMTSGELATFWKLPGGVEILDVMGPEGLAANLFRLTQTDAKLQRDQVQEEDTAIMTHHDVGQEVRQAIENIHQKTPEDLPRAASIRKLLEEKRRKTRKQLQKRPPDEQQPLF